MRITISLFFIFALAPILNGQSWEIFNTELKAEKNNGSISLSHLNGSESLTIEADTVYFDGDADAVFFEVGRLKGVIDINTLEILQKPLFLSLKPVDTDYYIVEVDDGLYFSLNRFPLKPVSEVYDDIYPLVPPQLNDCISRPYFVIVKRDHAGIISHTSDYEFPLIPAAYDEIVFHQCKEGNLIFYLRDKNEWGAGGKEGVEVKPAFDKIEHVFGEPGNNGFFIWDKDEKGLIMTGQEKPLIEEELSLLKYIPIGEKGFVFGLNNYQRVSDFLVIDRYGDVNTTSKFEHVIKVRELNKAYLVYTVDAKQEQLVLDEQAQHKLEFIVEEWIYLGY